jgi:trehalose 6-phosphate synthase
VDREGFAVTRGGKITYVRPQPISIDPDVAPGAAPAENGTQDAHLRQRLGVGDEPLLVGVDRLDYTKGIPERFRAVDRLLTLHPEWKGQFTFVQVGAMSRVQIPAYRQLHEELDALVDQINRRHGNGTWQPIVYRNEHYNPDQLLHLYRLAAGCVVSSLHDGMNLVAKEFVAARHDLRGVLLLSRFTGAAQELTDALLINPYDADDFAEALRLALVMPAHEQERRMRRLRQQVSDNNVYRWAGILLSEAGKLLAATPGHKPTFEGPYAEPDLSELAAVG